MRTRKRERESERVRVCVSERQIDSHKHTNMLLVQLLVERVLLRTPPVFFGWVISPSLDAHQRPCLLVVLFSARPIIATRR